MAIEAQASGQLAESLVELSLHQYQADGVPLTWIKTYPEFRVLDRSGGKVTGFFADTGPPDYALALFGRAGWLEVKTWQARDRHTLRERLYQYRHILDTIRAGGLGGYLVLWRWKGTEEWRYYRAESLPQVDGGLVFERSAGAKCDDSQGWPDWLAGMVTKNEH